jgi:hypothetical protein
MSALDEVYKNLAELKKLNQAIKDLESSGADVSPLLTSVLSIMSLAQEQVTKGLVNTNSDHNAIHKGYGFCMHLFYASLAPTAKQIYRLKGPVNLFSHIKSIQANLEGATCRFRLVKDATVVLEGTEITNIINNLNHNSARLPQTKVFDGGATYSGGSTWCSVVVHADTSGGGTTLSKSSGNFIQADYLEYVTKSNEEEYFLEIENLSLSDTAVNIDIKFFFYEEPQGLISGVL